MCVESLNSTSFYPLHFQDFGGVLLSPLFSASVLLQLRSAPASALAVSSSSCSGASRSLQETPHALIVVRGPTGRLSHSLARFFPSPPIQTHVTLVRLIRGPKLPLELLACIQVMSTCGSEHHLSYSRMQILVLPWMYED